MPAAKLVSCPALLLAMLSPLSAQHGYTPADIEAGGRLYRSNCVTCHGEDSTLVSGVDLGHGRFKRAANDTDLVAIIANGIPGTPMPPNNFTEAQTETILAYLHSMAIGKPQGSLRSGDASRGKAIFQGKGNCRSCHRVDGLGSRVGPDLSEIGLLRRPSQIEESLVDPNAEILPENRYVRAVTRQGDVITGRVLSENTFSLQIIDSQEQLRALSKSSLREYTFPANSSMPGYKDKLTSDELADLVSYLVSLKGLAAQ
jgi:putative heme-binding domain-containing protein